MARVAGAEHSTFLGDIVRIGSTTDAISGHWRVDDVCRAEAPGRVLGRAAARPLSERQVVRRRSVLPSIGDRGVVFSGGSSSATEPALRL